MLQPNLPSPPAAFLRALLLSSDIQVVETLCEAAQLMAIHIEPCCNVELATKKLSQSKFEGVIVDLLLPDTVEVLRMLRTTTSNRSAICLAVGTPQFEMRQAFEAGATFVLERPVSVRQAARLFKVSYSMMLNERRRSFRFPLCVPIVLTVKGNKIQGSTVNVSESGICVHTGSVLTPGMRVQMRLPLPGSSSLDLRGEVCWSDPTGKAGLQYCDPSVFERQVLQTWLSERLAESLGPHHEFPSFSNRRAEAQSD